MESNCIAKTFHIVTSWCLCMVLYTLCKPANTSPVRPYHHVYDYHHNFYHDPHHDIYHHDHLHDHFHDHLHHDAWHHEVSHLEQRIRELESQLYGSTYSGSSSGAGSSSANRYCDKLFNEGNTRSGVHNINVNGRMMEIYCEFQADGYNWLVFQRRESGTVDFYLDWRTYELGFGTKAGEFWLGLEALHQITAPGTCVLRVDLEDWTGNTAYAEYSHFSVGDARSNYRLSVGFYSGTAGDSLARHNNQPFSTKDRDNDAWDGTNCAVDSHGAWWYNACQYSNLNGEYLRGGQQSDNGINWFHWKYNGYSMKKSVMKLRSC